MTRRLLALLLIPALLIGAAVADGRHHRTVRGHDAAPIRVSVNGNPAPTVPPRTPANAGSYLPVMAGRAALDTAWFCVASSTSNPAADGVVLLANAGPSSAEVVVNAVADNRSAKAATVVVPAGGTAQVRLADAVKGNWVAATVVVDHGEVVPNLLVTHDGATSATPCASRASSNWYFPIGESETGTTEDLVFYNPYPEDASVDVALETPDGPRQPPSLQGVPVPSGQVVVQRVSDVERRRATLGATVTAPTGRVVAARVMSFDGSGAAGPLGGPLKGLSIALGEPTLSTGWAWPYSTKADGHSDQFVLYNPGQSDADVVVRIGVANPAGNGQVSAIPVGVPAGSVTTFDASKLRQIPGNSNYSVLVQSTNGVPVAVERLGERRTSDAHGVVMTPGSPVQANEWVLAAVDARRGQAFVTVSNPGDRAVRVRLRVLDGNGGHVTATRQIAAHDRFDFPADQLGGAGLVSVVVQADGPVLAGALQEQPRGLSFVLGVPARSSLRFP